MSDVKTPPKYPCSECGKDSLVRYCCGKGRGADWGGLVKKGENLCSFCFQKRGGGVNCMDFFSKRERDKP